MALQLLNIMLSDNVLMQTSKIGAKQKYGEIEDNPIGLPQKYCKTIVNQLNEDIASSYILFLQLRKQHAIIKGPDWKHIHDTLGEYAAYIGKQAEELSERLTVLGGLPLSDPSRFKDLAYVDFEGSDMLELRRMLENDLHAVQKTIEALRERIKNASENYDYGTEHMLKGIIFEYEEMADRLEHYLAMESLERNLTAR
jgi:DNA-binding ferritin-like protein